jgi:hypothetical protein
MLKIEYIRDGKNQIIANNTSGIANSETVVRNRSGRVLGHSNSVFNNVRDSQGSVVSRNSDDPDLLLRE